MQKITLLLIMITIFAWAKTTHTGRVIETMDSGGYSYMKISNPNRKSYWIAATKMDIKKDANITFSQEMRMKKFHSKTLNRTFDTIMFVSEVKGAKEAKDSHKQQNIHVIAPLNNALKKTKISPFKTADTLSVEEVFLKAKSLAGKTIKVRGKVTKVSHMIMKKNWIHIQDGTGDSKTDDIVFTSQNNDATVGDILTAKGIVTVDKDFGYGYFYPVIIQESSFTK